MTPGHGHAEGLPGAASWDERYRSQGQLWSGSPNPHLVSEASGLSPSTALDAGCGEGADAIWLAEHGWQVTAVDFSAVALERGAARAREMGAALAERITWHHADLTEWVPTAAAYYLVSAQFMQLPRAQRESLFRRLAASVAPGGTLLIVGHHPSDLQTTVRRPRLPALFYTGSDVAALLDPDGWDIIVNAARERQVMDPDDRSVAVHDTVLRAQRRR